MQNKKIANTNLILIRRLRVKNKQAKFSKLFKNIKFKPNLKITSSLKNSKFFSLNSFVEPSPHSVQQRGADHKNGEGVCAILETDPIVGK